MYHIYYTAKMKKDLKRALKRGCDIEKLRDVLSILASGAKLPSKYLDHQLIGNMKGFRECHIEPDWLLVYKIDNNLLILTAVATGTHSDVFR